MDRHGSGSPAPWLRKGALDFVEEVRERIEVVTPDQAAREYASGEAVILDVREPEEWNAGHVPGSVHVPRGRLELWADPTLPSYEPRTAPEQRILVLSGRGLRSMLAAATLGAMGYEHVASVAEGFEGWVAGGRPVEAAIDPTDDPGRGARKGGEDHRDPDPEHPRALD